MYKYKTEIIQNINNSYIIYGYAWHNDNWKMYMTISFTTIHEALEWLNRNYKA
jgi:hypothetical protein